MDKVRVGSRYVYRPTPIDQLYPPVGHPVEGQIVRVINMTGAPKANTMNHCYIASEDKMTFLGLCHVHSLQPVPKK